MKQTVNQAAATAAQHVKQTGNQAARHTAQHVKHALNSWAGSDGLFSPRSWLQRRRRRRRYSSSLARRDS